MSKKFLSPVNLTNGATLPTSGSAGDLFFKSDELKIYVHDGTDWVIAQGSGGTNFTWQGAWDSMAFYTNGDAVSLNGSSYVYISVTDGNSNPETTSADWGILAERGGAGLVWQGTWNSMTSYAVGDVVYYEGSSYVSTGGAGGGAPSSLMSWALVASKGDDGSAGINWRGEYDAMASYLPLDAVSYLGSSYVYKGIAFGNSTPEEGSSDWDVLAGGSTGGGGASVTVSDTAPSTPSAGNLWYNSSNGVSFIYYDSFWVELSPSIQGPTGPQGDVGPAGPTGIEVATSAPTDTSVLWADTSATGSYIVPASGSRGQVLTKITDSSYDTGWTTPQGSGNVIINGAFDFWQRGTSFTSSTVFPFYAADRWISQCTSSGTWTITATQQAFTAGTAPVQGYEGSFFYRHATSSGVTDGANIIRHRIEDVRTLAGQIVTISYWAKASAAITGYAPPFIRQNFGSGGSANVDTPFNSHTYSTSWVRYTASVTLPNVTGKTIGTSSYLELVLTLPNNAASTLDIWGVQLEAGSIATPFRRNAPSIQAELAACQRYYYRVNTELGTGGLIAGFGAADGNTIADIIIPLPSQMRVNPTSLDQSQARVYALSNGTNYSGGTWTLGGCNANFATARYTHGSGVFTSGSSVKATSSGSGSAFLGFSAEL